MLNRIFFRSMLEIFFFLSSIGFSLLLILWIFDIQMKRRIRYSTAEECACFNWTVLARSQNGLIRRARHSLIFITAFSMDIHLYLSKECWNIHFGARFSLWMYVKYEFTFFFFSKRWTRSWTHKAPLGGAFQKLAFITFILEIFADDRNCVR